MKHYLITIDGGTTNTRVYLWDHNGKFICSAHSETGVRDTAIDGNNLKLQKAVKGLIETLIQEHQISFDDIEAIYASGMVTSNVGLYELPHLTAPASLEDFARGIKDVSIDNICPLPISFIPGLKNMENGQVSLSHLEAMDIMRGEETEALALLSSITSDNNNGILLVLPGSHTKFVAVDQAGRLTGCLTSMAGEFLSMITNHSIVADAVQHQFVNQDIQSDYLLAGYKSAAQTSLSRAVFLTRILNQFLTKNQNNCASFLLGCVLQNDIAAIKTSIALKANPQMQVLVAGKEPLRSAMICLLKEDNWFQNVSAYSPDNLEPLSGKGALAIHKKRKEISE